MRPLRVSAISYLNTAPLMWDFEHGTRSAELRQQFEIEYTIPSRCAQKLAEGTADIGIIPVAAYATIAGLRILPDVAIASKNAVRSILLVSKVPIEQIHSVALDSSSRTSAALVQILLRIYKREVSFAPAEPQLSAMLAKYDAALLIGDPALQVDRSRYLTWDLAEEWRNVTGKPFVFAFWAIREGVASAEDLARIAQTFSASRDQGLKHIAEVAEEWRYKLPLSQEAIANYLSEKIHYHLDAENIEGMRLFFQLAASYGLLPPAPHLHFAHELEVRNSASAIRI